jgi:hypothetical protein
MGQWQDPRNPSPNIPFANTTTSPHFDPNYDPNYTSTPIPSGIAYQIPAAASGIPAGQVSEDHNSDASYPADQF